MDQKIEEKIYFKAKRIFDAYLDRKISPVSEKTFLIDLTGAMTKILKAEVNIRIQEVKHHPANSREMIKPGDKGYPIKNTG